MSTKQAYINHAIQGMG